MDWLRYIIISDEGVPRVIYLGEYFEDYKNPTEEEKQLFKFQTGYELLHYWGECDSMVLIDKSTDKRRYKLIRSRYGDKEISHPY